MSIRSGSVVLIMSLLSGMACSAETAGGQSGALGSTWADADRMPDLFRGMWMTFSNMVESNEKLNVPYTPKAHKYVAAYKPKRDIPYAQEGCRSPGLPISMRSGPIKFTYAPGLISIYMQAVGQTRFIRLNQKQGRTSPKYYGNSVGHWEGDTLVVETEDFLPEITFQYGIGKGLPLAGGTGAGNLPPPGGGPPGGLPPGGGPPGGLGAGPDGALGGPAAIAKAIWGPHGESMRMVERMRLVNPDTLEI